LWNNDASNAAFSQADQACLQPRQGLPLAEINRKWNGPEPVGVVVFGIVKADTIQIQQFSGTLNVDS
jgi:hypothetical protein